MADVWTYWTDCTFSGTSTTTAATIWTNWCIESTASTTTTIDVWSHWCSGTTATSVYVPSQRVIRTHAPLPTTPQQEEARQHMVERNRAEQRAVERAEECLLENLLPEQRRSWREKGHFVVHGRSGMRYRINRFRPGNVDVVNKDGVVEERLCIHSGSYIPPADNILAQKLHLEADEEFVMRIANKHGGTRERVLPALH